jgi:hypothetical protein
LLRAKQNRTAQLPEAADCTNTRGEAFHDEFGFRYSTGREVLLLSTTAGLAAVLSKPSFASVSVKTAAHQEPGNASDPAIGICETKYGKVRGFVEYGVLTFKGMPYGATTAGRTEAACQAACTVDR